ncbi:MAG: LutC/YkgG family protein [Ornithinimicrobium sp.]|uniref:LutC/YkgG family protein n=1 Tax=Ornithinimicrobium sp. TaxID=1977084 RepID=UPI003D9BE299
MSEARTEILRRVRTAIGEAPTVPEVPHDYRTEAGYADAQLRAVFTERLLDYQAELVTCADSEESISETLAGVLADRELRSVVAPPLVAQVWLGPVVEAGQVRVLPDAADVGWADLDAVSAVVTGAAVAIADTGVVVLDGDQRCGRRAISLIPDVHVCVVRAAQIVGLTPEAVARLDPRRPQTWIAGPSATSDIELDRVEGVHGPRTLIVVLAG